MTPLKSFPLILSLVFIIFGFSTVSTLSPSINRNSRHSDFRTNNGSESNISNPNGEFHPCESQGRTDLAFHRETMRCYELNTPGPCAENMIFYASTWPSRDYGDCLCDRNQPCVYNSSTKKCHVLFHKDYCFEGYWLLLNEFGNLDCMPNVCTNGNAHQDNHVLLNGACAKLGDVCGASAVVGYRTGSFIPECIKSEPKSFPSILPMPTPRPTCATGSQWSELIQKCDKVEDFRTLALGVTNEYRKKHHANPLTEDKLIDEIAQAYAEKLAAERSFLHSMREGYGENLYWYSGPAKSNSEIVLDALKSWYDEIKDYDYNLPLFDTNTAHFTQLIWKTTERQGVGVASNPKSNYMVVVINYAPPGNWEGEFFENVRRAFTPNETASSDFDDQLFTIY